MSHPPTLIVQFCQSGSVRVGLFHGNIVKPELLVGLFSNVARFNSSEKLWKSPRCSQPVSDNQKPLPSCTKECASALYQAGTGAPAEGRAGLSESPSIWISSLAAGWDLSSFKHLVVFWGGCRCKCPGWLWIAAALPGNRRWDSPFVVSLPLSYLSHWALLPSPRSSRTLSFTNSFSTYFLPRFLPILPFFWMFQVFPCSLTQDLREGNGRSNLGITKFV